MSRSGYVDDCEYLQLYRHTVKQTLRGQRGQAFLRELADTLDAMSEKVLISRELINDKGECCTIGTVCKARSLDVSKIDCDEANSVAQAVGISMSMAAEIAYMNDEWVTRETPAQRWERMRKWVSDKLRAE